MLRFSQTVLAGAVDKDEDLNRAHTHSPRSPQGRHSSVTWPSKNHQSNTSATMAAVSSAARTQISSTSMSNGVPVSELRTFARAQSNQRRGNPHDGNANPRGNQLPHQTIPFTSVPASAPASDLSTRHQRFQSLQPASLHGNNAAPSRIDSGQLSWPELLLSHVNDRHHDHDRDQIEGQKAADHSSGAQEMHKPHQSILRQRQFAYEGNHDRNGSIAATERAFLMEQPAHVHETTQRGVRRSTTLDSSNARSSRGSIAYDPDHTRQHKTSADMFMKQTEVCLIQEMMMIWTNGEIFVLAYGKIVVCDETVGMFNLRECFGV